MDPDKRKTLERWVNQDRYASDKAWTLQIRCQALAAVVVAAGAVTSHTAPVRIYDGVLALFMLYSIPRRAGYRRYWKDHPDSVE